MTGKEAIARLEKERLARIKRQAKYRAKKKDNGWRDVTVSMPGGLADQVRGQRKVGIVVGGGGFEPLPLIIEMRGDGCVVLRFENSEEIFRLVSV